MEGPAAIAALAALAHATRLAAFRLLMRRGPSGLPAGAVADALAVPASTLSFHLRELQRAGLVRSMRRQRQVIYAADIEGTRRLLAFLAEDCCDGRPELCGDLGRLAGGCRPSRTDHATVPASSGGRSPGKD